MSKATPNRSKHTKGKMESKYYCSAPWKGVTVRENGNVLTCCVGTKVLGNLRDQSIHEIMESDELKQIKDNMLTNTDDDNCRMCKSQEKINNYATVRNHYVKYYPLVDNDFSLEFLDIRWNNKCNLGCVYCDPEFSSVWEERKPRTAKLPARRDYQDELLAWVIDKSHEIRELSLVGGEPLLMKQNYELFRTLPQTAQISMITNLSYDLESLPCIDDLLKRPADKIIWNVSLENTHSKFEYIRNGASWDQVVKNFEFLAKHWPKTVSINMVYGLFSAFDLPATAQTLSELGINKINLMPVGRHTEMNLAYMPEPIRQQAIACLEQLVLEHQQRMGVDAGLYPIEGLEEILTGLRNSNNPSMTRDQVLKKIRWFDNWQKTNKFADLWPNVIDMVATLK